MLHEGLMDAAESHGSSEHHGANERAGEDPQGPSSDLNRPETDSDHDQKMVKTSQRMKESRLRCSGEILGVELGWMSGSGER